MIRNYLKIASRILTRHFLYFIVNLLGLSLGIACCIVAYFNWEFHDSFDSGHINEDRIFKINTVRNFEEQQHNYGVTPVPMADIVELEFTDVQQSARYSIYGEVIKLEDKVLSQQVAYADPEFLQMFSFPLIEGNINSLAEINQVFITEKTAEQYYAQSSALNQRLILMSKDGREIELIVAGIIEDHPLNSSFKYDLLLNYELYLDTYDVSEEEWSEFTHATFVLLNDNKSKLFVEEQVQKYVSSLNDSREDWEAESFYLVNLNDMGNHARYVRNSYLGNNNPEGAIMIPNIMAIVILLVACFNFMNTSIALSGNRLKEIGVRKAIGANRSQLIMQLLSENIFIILLALVGGIILAEVLLPIYTQLGPWLDLKINYAGNITFFSFLVGLLLLTALLSGAYPAFYVSRFNTSNIFSGRFRLKGAGALSKGLMVLQLGFSLIALIQGIVYVQNTYLQNGFDLGYKKHGVITIPYNKGVNFDSYRNKVLTHSTIDKVGGARHHMGYNVSSGIASIDAIKNEIRLFEVGDNYLEAMDFKIVSGETFLKDSEAEMDDAIIVNEYFLKDYELNDPLDQRVILDDHPYHIVGVVKDFYPFGLWKSENDLPSIIKLVDEDQFGFIVANVNSDIDAADKYLEKEWKAMFQDVPYESEKENIHVYRSELLSGNMAVLNIFLALTALFLSATGLFTLISINIQKRTKEIGLRRIMGASIPQIVRLINKGFIIVVLVSVVFGSVLGTYLTEMFLDIMYSIHSHVGVLAIGLTTGLVILIVILTSGFKVIKAADSPPVEALKHE